MRRELKQCAKCGGFDGSPGPHCVPCKRAAIAAYEAENPGAKNVRTLLHRADNLETYKANQKAYAEANRDKIKAYRQSEEVKKKLRSWYAASYEKNKEERKAANAAWQKANPDKVRIYKQNRRARERDAIGNLSKGLVEKLLKLQKGKCPCCKKPLGEDFHLDHVIPLARGGSSTDGNMQLLRKTCNHQKSSKHPVDFMQERGFLL